MLNWLIATITTLLRNTQQVRRSSLLPLIAPFLALIALGTLVYAWLKGWTLLDALYATIITMTTVGYGDVAPRTVAGRTFAIFFTLFAIGLAGYALSTAAAIVFEGHQAKIALKRLENRMKKIAALSNLSAKDMARRLGNPKLRIVASARDEQNMHTLYLAGADRVISPNIMGGFSVASQMLDHDTAELWDQMLFQSNQQMRFGDLRVADYPALIGQTTEDVRRGLAQLVLAIRRNGEFLYTPDPSEIVQPEDTLIVMGPNL